MILRRLRCKLRSIRANLGLGVMRTTWDGHCWDGDNESFLAAGDDVLFAVRCVDCDKLEIGKPPR